MSGAHTYHWPWHAPCGRHHTHALLIGRKYLDQSPPPPPDESRSDVTPTVRANWRWLTHTYDVTCCTDWPAATYGRSCPDTSLPAAVWRIMLQRTINCQSGAEHTRISFAESDGKLYKMRADSKHPRSYRSVRSQVRTSRYLS